MSLVESSTMRHLMHAWKKFSIRSAFLAIAIVAFAIGWIVHVERTQKRAERDIYASGGETRWRQPGPRWLTKVLGRDVFAYVTHVIFIDVPVGEEDLRPIAKFHRLESLLIAQNPTFDGFGLEHTAGLKHLQRIDLYDVPVTNEGFRQLPYQDLPGLCELQVVGCLTDECLDFVRKLNGIAEISVSGTLTKSAVQQLNDEMPGTALDWSGQGYIGINANSPKS